MNASLQEEESGHPSGPARLNTFGKLAELVRRYLGCEAAVLSVDDPVRSLCSAVPGEADGRSASAAFRQGREAGSTVATDLATLTNPLVAGAMGMRFYAGLPLHDHRGRSIGMLAAMDRHERVLGAEEFETLKLLAGMAGDLYEMRRAARTT
jgi:GAF domain-containing protein